MLHLTACRCMEGEWARAKRPAWMRALFPMRMLFECAACHRRFLVRPGAGEADDAFRVAAFVVGVASAICLTCLSIWWWSTDARATGPNVAATRPATRPAATSCQRVHIFKEGETFESIAEQELGDSSKWQEIRLANHWLDMAENGLEPGARLVVPAPCAE